MSAYVERCEKRTDATLVGAIRLADGTEIPCIVRDVSPHGARLGVPQACRLPDTFLFTIKGREFVFLVRLAWRRNTFAGVRIERVSRLTDTARAARSEV